MAPEAVVAGHLCLDIIPEFKDVDIVLEPGRLNEIGPAHFSAGGAVANVGTALGKLGVPTLLIGKVGDDPFGTVLTQLLAQCHPRATRSIRVAAGESTSYTYVISKPGLDRIFFHHSGCNDTYCAADVDVATVSQARLFHFGYPPLMRGLYTNNGKELEILVRKIKRLGVTISLDMAMPDPGAPSGHVDWRSILKRVLPHVDVFVPSLEETLYMLDRSAFENGSWRRESMPAEFLYTLSGELLSWGAAVVVIKLGVSGIYMRSADAERLNAAGRARPEIPEKWSQRELWAPAFRVDVVGTTGAGDAAVAGFLAGVLSGLGPEESLTIASGVGACCVEALDATSGIRSWQATLDRIQQGWPRAVGRTQHRSWQYHQPTQVYRGPHDKDWGLES